MDPRAAYFAESVLQATGVSSADRDKICSDGAMQRFLEDPSCALLVATSPEGNVNLANELDPAKQATSKGPTLILTKLRPQALSAGNMMSLVSSSSLTVGTSPLEGLAATLKHVYAPLLKASPTGGRLATVLSELQAGLASELRLSAKGSSGGAFDENDASNIQSPSDEFELWTELGGRGDARAKGFAGAFTPISRAWYELPSCTSEEEVLELLETTQDTFDDVWKMDRFGAPFSQVRMKRLFEVSGAAITRFVHGRLSTLDLWTAPFPKVERALNLSLAVCRRAVAVADTLSAQFWATYPAHAWKGEPHTDETLQRCAFTPGPRITRRADCMACTVELTPSLAAGWRGASTRSRTCAP
jgi:hypothetical protein